MRRQSRLAEPLIDLRLFRAPTFTTALAANTLALFVVAGTLFYVAQHLQLVLDMDPLTAGLWTLPSAAAFIVGSTLAPLSARRLYSGLVVAGGLAVAALGAAVLTQVGATSGLAVLVAALVTMNFGLAHVITLSTDLIVGSAPPQNAGAASAISEMGTELGAALGVAVLGTAGTAVYRAARVRGVCAASRGQPAVRATAQPAGRPDARAHVEPCPQCRPKMDTLSARRSRRCRLGGRGAGRDRAPPPTRSFTRTLTGPAQSSPDRSASRSPYIAGRADRRTPGCGGPRRRPSRARR